MAVGLAPLPAVSIALKRGRTLLLVKRGRAPSLGLFAFPGGHAEAGESLEEAVRRELREETGLAARTARPLRRLVLPLDDGRPAFELTVFAGEAGAGAPVAADDAAEAGFFTLAEMRAMPLAPFVLDVAAEILG